MSGSGALTGFVQGCLEHLAGLCTCSVVAASPHHEAPLIWRGAQNRHVSFGHRAHRICHGVRGGEKKQKRGAHRQKASTRDPRSGPKPSWVDGFTFCIPFAGGGPGFQGYHMIPITIPDQTETQQTHAHIEKGLLAGIAPSKKSWDWIKHSAFPELSVVYL